MVNMQIHRAYQGQLMFELQKKIVRDAAVDAAEPSDQRSVSILEDRLGNPILYSNVAWPDRKDDAFALDTIDGEVLQPFILGAKLMTET